MENQNRPMKNLVLWRFMDGKPGHEKQTAGLIYNLKQHIDVELVTINCSPGTKNQLNFFLKNIRKG